MSNNYNTPPELLGLYQQSAVTKCGMSFVRLSVLAVLAGAYIAFGAEFSTIVLSGTYATIGFGLAKTLAGISFATGLVLVVVCGGELFTGNCMLVVDLPPKKISLGGMFYNWVVVYFANFVGALIFVGIVVYGGIWMSANNITGETALTIAAGKCSLTWVEAILRGIGCNWMVCLGVWIALAGRDIVSKIAGIVFPIAAFVAMGFEHCVANMYFIPKALLLKNTPQMADFVAAHGGFSEINLYNFIVMNQIPVTIGNIIGGALFVGMAYYMAYRCRP